MSPAARIGRFLVGTAAAIGLIAAAVVVPAAPASAATELLTESFTGNTVASSEFEVGGNGFIPCLTAAGGTTGTPTTCAVGPGDADGSGTLRLTDNQGSRAGYTLFDYALPTRGGLDISFTQYQWGGNGADGISFFLTDGDYRLDAPGPSGGALGYNSDGTAGGLAHALLGVGLDAYGNYSYQYQSPECTTRTTASAPDSIAVRGPAGNVAAPGGTTNGYCLLAQPVPITDSGTAGYSGMDRTNVTTRPQGKDVRIVVEPSTYANPQVIVSFDGRERIRVASPTALRAAETFKFGWAASTGGVNNNHEVNYLKVSSVVDLGPDLLVTTPAAVDVTAGQPFTIPVDVRLDTVGGPGSAPITAVVDLPTGASFSGIPSGDGWVCPAPAAGATSVTCSYTPTPSTISGSSLPRLSVPVVTSVAGDFSAAITVDSTDNVLPPATTSAVADVTPVAAAVSGSGVASATPTTISVDPTAPTGTGTTTYQLATLPPAAEGTATIDATTGRISFTPAAGASGVTTFTYTATVNGEVSAPATARFEVTPTAAPDSKATTVGVPVAFDLSTLTLGTGRVYSVTAPPAAQGTAALVDGVVTFTPAAGFSGSSVVAYTVTDSDGLTQRAELTITVLPTATDVAARGTLDAAGDAVVVTPAPTVSGTGPFRFAVESGPGTGSAVIDPATGVVTYTAAEGVSGVFEVEFTATDAANGETAVQTATITVAPYLTASGATTTVGEPVDLPAPTAVGTDLVYSLVGGSDLGTAEIDPVTGVVTYTPTGTRVGNDEVVIRVTDADDVTTDRTVVVVVRPTVADVEETTTASATPVGTAIALDGTGDGVTYAVTTPLSAARGTVALDGDSVTITPAAGVSGRLTVSYTATSADGVTSTPAEATLIVAPVAQPGQLRVESGSSAARTVPTPLGTGPFAYALAPGALPAGIASAVLDRATGRLTVTAAEGFSGIVQIPYVVTDADGIPSAPVAITVTVAPIVEEADTLTLPTTIPGGTPSTATTTVTPEGTGPFAFALVTPVDPAVGTTTIDPATGLLSFTAAPGVSGTVEVPVRVTDAAGTPITVTILVEVVPVVADVDASTVASDEPTAVDIPLLGYGTGLVYTSETELDAAQGTAVISGGAVSITPAPGFSGTIVVDYIATDADGLESTPASATLVVRPAAEPVELLIESGTRLVTQLPAPTGTGPFEWTLGTLPAGIVSAVLDPETGELTLVAAEGFSGDVVIEYTVTDDSGLVSAPAPIAVRVVPTLAAVPPVTVPGTEPGTPGTPAIGQPVPNGTGPWEYELTTPPTAEQGVATIDPETGEIRFVAEPGFSGVVRIGFTVTDAAGNEVPGVFEVTVLPIASIAEPATVRGTQGDTLTSPRPTPSGDGPFRFELVDTVDPATGTVTIDPATGVVTFVPADGFTGELDVRYVVIDANGLRSEPAVVTFVLDPAPAVIPGLAATGTEVSGGLLAALLALLAGVGLLVVRRRREV